MPDIEFQEVVGQIDDVAARERERMEVESPAIDKAALRKLMREDACRRDWLRERLRA